MFTHTPSAPRGTNCQRPRTISEIDSQIEFHLQELRFLRKQRNELASRTQYLLPADILLYIFMIYQKGEVHDFIRSVRPSTWYRPVSKRLSNQHPVPYVFLSHVCMHWRRVALDYPPFWSVLFFNNTHWTSELLIRSKNSPLDLHVRIPQSMSPWVEQTTDRGASRLACLKMALSESHRFERLELDITQLNLTAPGPSKAWVKALKKLVSNVRDLRLLVNSNYDSSPPTWEESILSQLTKSLGKTFPPMLLRSLEVASYSMASFGPKFASDSLTRLECKDISFHIRPQPSFYLELVRRLPALEILILDKALPLVPEEGPLESVYHASLKKLVLRGGDATLGVYAQILDHLKISPLTSLYLSGRCFPVAPGFAASGMWGGSDASYNVSEEILRKELSTLIVSLQPFLGVSSSRTKSGVGPAPPFYSMLVETLYDGLNLALARENPIIADNIPISGLTNIDIQIELYGMAALKPVPTNSDLDPSAIVLETFHDILQSVEHAVVLETPDNQSPTSVPSLVSWIEAFSVSNTLKTMDLTLSTSLRSLVWYLDKWRAERLDGEDGPVAFQSLDAITIREIRFDDPSLYTPTKSSRSSSPSSNEQEDNTPLQSLRYPPTDDPLDVPLPVSPPLSCSPSPSLFSPLSKIGPQSSSREIPAPRTFFLPSPNGRDFPSIFKARREIGFHLHKLTFRNCAAFGCSVSEQFKEFVDEVEWDGLESVFWDPWLPPVPIDPPPMDHWQTSSDESEDP
ncbi:hypothetical protein DL96DRAFT_1614314 [Flagelloscypha sp. PMI_526]|nr:hypothetical protein DL96DRAFT_1614314 [Flagelloscypha sp. PMI_526]